MNKRYRGFVLVALGLVMVLAGVGLHFLHERQDELAGQNAGALLEELIHEIRFSYPAAADDPAAGTPDFPSDPEPGAVPMASRTLSGYDLVGILRVPSVGVELPVLGQWSYSLLNVAPCRYSGSVETGDLIILGHNYKSHLQPLERVAVGDSVEFTDVNGVTHRYVAAAVDVIRGSDSDKLASDCPLTVFTCTYDGQHRIVVRCVPAEE